MSIIYGKNSVETYLQYAPQEINQLILQAGLQERTAEHFTKLAKEHQIPLKFMARKELERNVERDAVHQGILADIKPFNYANLETAIAKTKKTDKLPFFVLIDQLQDPRNLGAILRTADCCGGVDGIIITRHHSVEVTAAVIKTSTGAALNIPIIQVTNARNAIQTLKAHNIWTCGLNMTGATHYRKEKYDLPLCLVVGGEDSGVRPIIQKEVDFNVYIPMHSQTVTSLNVSVATSLLLYEVAFQREN